MKANRIAGSSLHGRLGASSFSGLTGSLLLGEAPKVTLSSGQARLSVDELFPWLSSTDLARGRLKELRSARGTVDLSSISAGGPLGTAGGWRYEASGRVTDLVLDGIPLPGPVTIRRGEFHLRPGIASFSGFDASLLDAIARGSAEFRHAGGAVSRRPGPSKGRSAGRRPAGRRPGSRSRRSSPSAHLSPFRRRRSPGKEGERSPSKETSTAPAEPCCRSPCGRPRKR